MLHAVYPILAWFATHDLMRSDPEQFTWKRIFIAGQHEDYLLQALLAYKRGERKNAIMAAQVENLQKQDLADLAAWFGSQKGLAFKR